MRRGGHVLRQSCCMCSRTHSGKHRPNSIDAPARRQPTCSPLACTAFVSPTRHACPLGSPSPSRVAQWHIRPSIQVLFTQSWGCALKTQGALLLFFSLAGDHAPDVPPVGSRFRNSRSAGTIPQHSSTIAISPISARLAVLLFEIPLCGTAPGLDSLAVIFAVHMRSSSQTAG